MKRNLFYFLILGSVLILSGCIARTYSLTKERVDQDLSSGNRGYLIGKAPAEEESAPRKEERTIRVFEVEIGESYPTKQVDVPPSSITESAIIESDLEAPFAETTVPGAPSQKYTVAKNDTLQKISKKFYGTTKKWVKIYSANKDVLKGPDKVYPGQVINIPDIGENLKENLK